MGPQGLEVPGVLLDEGLVVQTLLENDANHSRQDGCILTGPRLQVKRRLAGGLGPARVDDDDLDPAFQGPGEMPAGVDGGQPAQLGHHGVRAEEEPRICIRKGHVSPAPAAVDGRRDDLSGLVDGPAGERHGRADLVHERIGEHGGRRGQGIGARIEGHGLGPVGVDDLPKLRGDLPTAVSLETASNPPPSRARWGCSRRLGW